MSEKRTLLRNKGFQSLLSSLLCILVGLLVGYIVLLIINPAGAGEAIRTIVENFFYYPSATARMRYLGNTLVKTAPLLLIRPVSGSAALAVGADLIARYGVDSTIGLTAAVMLGSTETTFYTICVYFGAARIQKTRYAIPAALIADFTGFLVASVTVRWFF